MLVNPVDGESGGFIDFVKPSNSQIARKLSLIYKIKLRRSVSQQAKTQKSLHIRGFITKGGEMGTKGRKNGINKARKGD